MSKQDPRPNAAPSRPMGQAGIEDLTGHELNESFERLKGAAVRVRMDEFDQQRVEARAAALLLQRLSQSK